MRLHLGVLALYALLAAGLTWPLVTHLWTHVPGVPQWAFDESTFVWNIWYFKHAVVDNLASPLHSELIYYPLGIDLLLYTYNFYHVLAALPLALAFNLPLASNLTLLGSTILSGYGTFLLIRDQAGRRTGWRLGSPTAVTLGAFVGGALYAFASNRAVYAALGHYDMVTTQWIPFYALMLLRSLDAALTPRLRRRAALLGGVFFALTGLAEMISALFLGIFTGIVLLLAVLRGRRLPDRWARLAAGLTALAIIGAVAFVLWSPALVPILLAFVNADYDLKGWGDALILSADLLGWFTPTVFHPLFGGDIVRELHLVQQRALNPELPGFRDLNTVFLGWASLALAAVGALAYRRRVEAWIWTAVLFGVFTLGPLLQVNGRTQFDMDGIATTVPLPYALLHYLPIVQANRAPNRNSVLLMLGLAVLAGYGVLWLLHRWERRRATGAAKSSPPPGAATAPLTAMAAVAVGLILFEHLALPFPLSDARIPGVYAEIAADPAEGSILQLPLGWRNSFGVFGPEQTLLQYYQSAHGRPMLGGNISRAPDFKMDYFKRIPYFQALTEIQFGRPVPPELLEAAAAQAEELAYLYDTEFVVLTPPVPDRLPYADTWQAAWDFVKSTWPLADAPFYTADGIEAYRVRQGEGSDTFALDLGEPGTFPYRAEGWDAAETDNPYEASATWATAPRSRLFLPLRQVDPTATYTVRLRAHPFAYAGSPQQTVALTVNGVAAGQRAANPAQDQAGMRAESQAPHQAQPLGPGWQEITWQIPGSALVNGLNRLDLTWGYTAVPRTVTPGSRQIGATGVELPIDADLKAFADGGFIALFDAQGEQIDASTGRRGVNVTVLDSRSGAVVQAAGFDTTANEGESARLAAFLSEIPAGAPVLVASYGDAWAHLTEEAVAGLRGIGADVTREGLQSQYFAIVGVQGAAPGSAVQTIDPADAFTRVSLNRDRRPLAAAVDFLELTR